MDEPLCSPARAKDWDDDGGPPQKWSIGRLTCLIGDRFGLSSGALSLDGLPGISLNCLIRLFSVLVFHRSLDVELPDSFSRSSGIKSDPAAAAATASPSTISSDETCAVFSFCGEGLLAMLSADSVGGVTVGCPRVDVEQTRGEECVVVESPVTVFGAVFSRP